MKKYGEYPVCCQAADSYMSKVSMPSRGLTSGDSKQKHLSRNENSCTAAREGHEGQCSPG